MRTSVDRGTYSNFIALQDSDSRQGYTRVFLYRRYWDAVSETYLYAASLEITSDVIPGGFGMLNSEIGSISGEYKSSNMSILLRSESRKYGRNGTVWSGYIPDYSRVVIEAGYVAADDSQNGVNVFYGYLAQQGIDEGEIIDGKCRLNLIGGTSILDAYSAEDIAGNKVAGESLTGTGVDWFTANNAVGIVQAVYVNGARVRLGKDYNVGDLNEKASPGYIEFTDTYGTPTHTPTIDYTFWDTDAEFYDLLVKLLDHAGQTDYNIQPVTFSTQFPTQRIVDEDAEFDAGTKEGTETDGNDKLYTGAFYYRGAAQQAYYFKDLIEEVPAYSFYAQSYTPVADGALRGVRVFYYLEPFSLDPGNIPAVQDATVDIQIYAATIHGKPTGDPLSEVIDYNFTTLAFVSTDFVDMPEFAQTASQKYVLVITIKTGKVCLAVTASDDTLETENAYFGGWIIPDTASLQFSVETNISSWMSATLNTAGIQAFSNFVFSAGFGNYTFYSMTKAADTDWPASFTAGDWDLISGGTISSTPRAYTRFAATIDFNTPSTILTETPYPAYIDSTTLSYVSDTYLISVANYTGMTVKDAQDKLAEMCNYIYGNDSSNHAFFNAREYNESADYTIVSPLRVYGFDIDWERVINEIKVSHGGYTAIVNKDTEGTAEPTSEKKYGKVTLSMDFSTIAADPDADIAYGIARTYYDEYGVVAVDGAAKKKVNVVVLPLLALELGDTVGLSSTYITASPVGDLWYIGKIGLDLNNFRQELLLREL